MTSTASIENLKPEIEKVDPEKKKQTFVNKVFAAWLKKEEFEKVQKKVERKISKATSQADKALTNFNKKFNENVGKLSDEDRKKPEKVLGQLDKVSEEIAELASKLKNIERTSSFSVIEQKIKTLNALKERLRNEINNSSQEDPEIKTKKEHLSHIKNREVALLLRELYRNDHSEIAKYSSEILGMKYDLLEQISGKDKIEDISFETKALLADYHSKLSELRKDNRKGEIELESSNIDPDIKAELNKRIQKEQQRFKRTAEIRSLREKFQSLDSDKPEYISPTKQIRYLKLLRASLNDLQNADINSNNEEEKSIALLRTDLGEVQNTNEQIQLEIEKIDKTILDHEQKLNTNLKQVDNIEQRKEVINSEAKDLQKKFLSEAEGGTGELVIAEKIEQTTNYEAQIAKRLDLMEKENEEIGHTEFISGLDDMVDDYIKSYESTRLTEREGSIERRAELAKGYAREQIMEQFSNVEKIRALYGDNYDKIAVSEIDKNAWKKDADEFKSELLNNIEELFNITKDGIKVEEAEITPEEKNKADEIAKEIHSNINNQVEKIIKNEQLSKEAISEIEGNSEKREIFTEAIKGDIKLSRFKSEFKEIDFSKFDINQVKQFIELSHDDELDKLPSVIDFNSLGVDTTNIKNRLNSLKNSFGSIESLFEKNPKDEKYKYEITSTPNGIALAFKDAKELSTAILGPQELEDTPETLAVTLDSSNNTENAINNINYKNENWDGEVILVGTDRGKFELLHETQHAVMRGLKSEMINSNESNFNGAVEELAIKLATGEIWEELALPDVIRDEKRISLAATTYVTPDSLPKEDAVKLHQILEISKKIIGQEVNYYDSNVDGQMSFNIFGDILSEIITSTITDSGRYDLDAALKEIKARFIDDEEFKFKLNETQEIQNPTKLTDANYFGTTNQEEINREKEKYNKFANDSGFDYKVVGAMDTRGRANIAYDHYMGPKAGVERKETVGGLPSAELPLVSPLVNYVWGKKGFDRGPNEYHVAHNLGSILNPFNYKFRGRGWGGILRKIQEKNVPIIAPLTKIFQVDERQTKFGTSFPKIFNDLPPFGRGWERIMADLTPGLNHIMKKKFPGRPEAYEAVNPHAEEIWNKGIKVLAGNLGGEGLGFSQSQVQRILGELPGMAYEFEMGRLKFEPSMQDMETIDEDGKHRGRLKEDFLAGVNDDKFRLPENKPSDEKPNIFGKARADWEKAKSKYNKNVKINDEVPKLAQVMNEAYDKENYAYTMNDLITAAHLAHDLGINVVSGVVRNKYYQTDQGSFVQDGDRMIGDHVWYSTVDPAKRGVVIAGECFSLDAVNEMIKRYSMFYISRALEEGLPEVTPMMQDNKFKPDPDQRVKISLFGQTDVPITEEMISSSTIMSDPTSRAALEQYFTTAGGRLGLKDDYAWFYDGDTQQHFVHKLQYVRDRDGNVTPTKMVNKFYNPTGYKAPIPGIKKDKMAAEQWKRKADFDWDTVVDGFKEEYTLLSDYVRRRAEIARYERKAYYAKTFWGDTKQWIQRIGGAAMIGSVIGAAITGAPFYTGLFLGTLGLQALGVNIAQHKFKLFSQRRVVSLDFQQKLGSLAGAYQPIIEGRGTTRLERQYLRTIDSDINAKMEDLAKEKIPKGSYPEDDWAHTILGSVFGQKGVISQALS